MEQIVANGLYLGAQYALIALGLTLIFALMNVLNFAHGQMYVLGGFVTYEIYGLLHWPFVIALIASALTLAVLGALIERFLFRTVIRRSEREESTMLLAAGIAYFLDAAILLLFGEKQRGVRKIVTGVFSWDNLILPWDRILVAGLAALFIVAFILMMQFTKPGRAMRALASVISWERSAMPYSPRGMANEPKLAVSTLRSGFWASKGFISSGVVVSSISDWICLVTQFAPSVDRQIRGAA